MDPVLVAKLIKAGWTGVKQGASWINTNFNAVDQVMGGGPIAPLEQTASPLVQVGGISQQTLMIALALGAFLILKK